MAPIPNPNTSDYVWYSTTGPNNNLDPITEARLEELLQEGPERIIGRAEDNTWYQRFVSPTTSTGPSLIEVLQKMEGLYTEIQVLERRVAQLESEKAVGKRFLQKTKSE